MKKYEKRRNFSEFLPCVQGKFASSWQTSFRIRFTFPANLWKEKILCSKEVKELLLAMLTFDFSLCQVSSVMWTCDRCNYLLAAAFSRLFSLHLWKRIFPQCYKNPEHGLILGKPIFLQITVVEKCLKMSHFQFCERSEPSIFINPFKFMISYKMRLFFDIFIHCDI